jgi:tRNA-(ms[2]io[6]A)-hydroxylase
MSDAPKRRLPVLQAAAPAGDDEAQDRPAWHWSVLGAVLALLAWLPLAATATSIAMRTSSDLAPDGGSPPRLVAAMIVLNAIAYALASLAAGALVGRFGGRAGRREATLTGPIAGLVAWVLSVSQRGPGPGPIAWALLLVTLAALGAGASNAGARIGLALRARR